MVPTSLLGKDLLSLWNASGSVMNQPLLLAGPGKHLPLTKPVSVVDHLHVQVSVGQGLLGQGYGVVLQQDG